MDSEGLKYIDYDLDVKLFPNGEVLELDRDEYQFNQKYLHYSEKIVHIIEQNLNELIKRIDARVDPFNSESVYRYYQTYLDEKQTQK